MNKPTLVGILGLALLLTEIASATSYVYGNDQLIAKVNDSGVYYYHSDRIGSTSAMTDSEGEVIEEQVNLPFGQLVSGSERYGFTGKELDETGLNYFGARYYNPTTGRFLTFDSFGGQYIYAGNNPLRLVDPDGNLDAYPPIEQKHTPEEKKEVKKELRKEGGKFVLGITGIEAVTSLPGLLKRKQTTGVSKSAEIWDNIENQKVIAKIEKTYMVQPVTELVRPRKASWFTKFRWKFFRFGKFLRVGGRVLGGIGQIFVIRNSFMNVHKIDMDYMYGEGNWLDPKVSKMIPKEKWREVNDYFRRDLNIAVRIKDKEVRRRHEAYLWWLVQFKLGKDLNDWKNGDPYIKDPYDALRLLKRYHDRKGDVKVPKLYPRKKR